MALQAQLRFIAFITMLSLANSSEIFHRSASRFRFTGVSSEVGMGGAQLLGT